MSVPSHNASSNCNLLRQFLDSKPKANDGFLSYAYGLCHPHPLRRLTQSSTTNYSIWEDWAENLPHLYQTGKYIDYFDLQPVLDVDKLLADKDLLRANQVLALCAHATVHFAPRPRISVNSNSSPTSSRGTWVSERKHKKQELSCPFKGKSNTNVSKASTVDPSIVSAKEALIPPSILVPWKQVSTRLGRRTPTFTYYDYFTANVIPHRSGESTVRNEEEDAKHRRALFSPKRSAEQTYHDLRCDVQVFGDQSENIFVLVNHDMEFQSKDLVKLCCDAIDHVLAKDDDALTKTLHNMGEIVKKITDAFVHIVPNSRSAHYCDPVSWSKSIGMLIPPILNDEFSMSGLQSSVVHLLDVFLGRYDFTGELGDLALAERPWLPSLHQEFFRLLQSSPSVRQCVCTSKSRSLKGQFDRVVRLFGSEQGFLGAHRIKTIGFLEIGIKTGRTESSGGTAKTENGWQARVWRKINDDFILGMSQRMKLQTNPIAEGFTPALVQSIEELSKGSESYRITMNIKNAGLSYKAGDRLEIIPANTLAIIKRMLISLEIGTVDLAESSICMAVDQPIWREAIARFYPELANEEQFPLPSLLRLMKLRPLTRYIIDAICAVAGMKGHADVESAFRQGSLNDVPDLIDLLHSLASNACAEALYSLPSKLCSILPPNETHLYSIANSPPQGVHPTVVTIVVSKLWFQAEKVIAENKSINLHKSLLRRQSVQDMLLDNSNPNHQFGGDDSGKVIHLGVCTSFLLEQSLFTYVPIRVAEEESFHLPQPNYGIVTNPPLLFLALGSGAAPIMAFLEELISRDIGDCSKDIYFCWGLRETKNLCWLPLLSKAIKKIGLKLCISFSGEFKTVVADDSGNLSVANGEKERITETLLHGDWPEVLSRLANNAGHFYLCGHPSLGLSFRAVLESAFLCAGKLSPEKGRQQYEQLVADGRLHSDCFFSGSIHDPTLPNILFSDVARHSNFDDGWWIYKGSVYNVTDYMSLHPGGAKILFDKAGRDCTKDFEVAHGHNNLRVESGMHPYMIGNVSPGLCSESYPDKRAFQHAVAFLHTITEIKNVYHLDVNMFAEDEEECKASPHSLSMRCKTAEKFVSSTLPLLISAATHLCEELEKQIPRSTMVSLKWSVPFQLVSFMNELQQILGNISSDGPYSKHPSVVTEICNIGCSFVSDVQNEAIEWVSSIELQEPVETFPNLSATSRQTLLALQSCMDSMHATLSGEIPKHMKFQGFFTALGGRWLRIAPWLEKQIAMSETTNFAQGHTILRKGDIVSCAYVVLSGKVAVLENETTVDMLASGAVFGATTAPLLANRKQQMIGNELMKSTVRVESNEVTVCIITPQQMLQACESFLMTESAPKSIGVVVASSEKEDSMV